MLIDRYAGISVVEFAAALNRDAELWAPPGCPL
jgi:hypothetical protein